MGFIIRDFEKKDYPRLAAWWTAQNCLIPDEEFLPPTGLIIERDDIPMCAGFLFKTDAKIAIMNHIVANPERVSSSVDRGLALRMLIAALMDEARECKMKMVTAASNIEKLNQRYLSMGFFKSDSNESHFGRIL